MTGDYIVAALFCSALLTGLALWYALRAQDVFHPMVVMTAVHFLSGPLAAMGAIALQRARPEDTLRGLTWINIGCLVAVATFQVATQSSRAFGVARYGVPSPSTTWVLVTLFGATLVARLWAVSRGVGALFVGAATWGTGPLDDLLVPMHDSAYYLSLLALGNSRSLSKSLGAVAICGIEIGLQAVSGSRGAALGALLPFAFFFSRARTWRKGAVVALFFVLFFTLVVTLPVIDAYRRGGTIGIERLLSASTNVQTATAFDYLIQRVDWTRNVSIVVEEVPSRLPFQYGNTFWPGLLWFIPRALWPGKPKISIGAWFAHNFLGWDPASESEAAITVWGDAWLNFGALGVLMMGCLLGLAHAGAYRTWYRWRRPLDGLLYWTFLSVFGLWLEANVAAIVGMFGTRVAGLLIVYLSYRALGGRWRRAGQAVTTRKRLVGVKHLCESH